VVPIKGKDNLQKQPMLALAVLAKNAGKAVTMVDLAEGMHDLGGLRRKPVVPEAGEIRYRILKPFRSHVQGKNGITEQEIEGLIETIPSVGLRLNVSGRVIPDG
jgi:hypothetical protein